MELAHVDLVHSRMGYLEDAQYHRGLGKPLRRTASSRGPLSAALVGNHACERQEVDWLEAPEAEP